MLDQEQLLRLLVTAVPLLFSLTIHEYAHARTALAFGDPTALYSGRVTLNPLAHLDPIGTICLLFSGIIGWAKPVPVNTANLHPRGLGNFAVSAAGPGSNLCLAAISWLLLKLYLAFGLHYANLPASFTNVLWMLLAYTMVANVGLCVFNLIPLHPLDGSHILQELLPFHLHHRYIFWQARYGMPLLAILIFGPKLLAILNIHVFDPVGFILNLAISIAGHSLGLGLD
ncbi:MAG: site-2 protease family protein [Phycisphaerae bacterium]